DAEKPKLDHAIGGGSWAARNLRLEGVHRCRRADRVRAALSRPLSSCSHLRRQNSSRRQSFQSSCRATDEIRADHQPQSRKGDRASGAYGIDGSRRRGDRIRAALLRLLTAACCAAQRCLLVGFVLNGQYFMRRRNFVAPLGSAAAAWPLVRSDGTPVDKVDENSFKIASLFGQRCCKFEGWRDDLNGWP